jgi:hypothetical protein
MNPFQAIMGGSAPMQTPTGQMGQQMMCGPIGMLQGAIQRAQQMAQQFQNPQQMVQQFFPDAPADVQGDPNQLLQWMQQTGKVNPQMVQMARQMMGVR